MRFLIALLVLSISVPSTFAQSPSPTPETRLERLASHLEKTKPKKFTMGRWGDRTNASDPDFYGCGAGYATAIPEFADAGFRLERIDNCVTVTYNGFKDYNACSAFFGITHGEAIELFGNNGETVTSLPHKLRAVAIRPPPALHYAFNW